MAQETKKMTQVRFGQLLSYGWQLRFMEESQDEDDSMQASMWDREGKERSLMVEAPVRPEPKKKEAEDTPPTENDDAEAAAEQAREADDAEAEGKSPEETQSKSGGRGRSRS